MLLKSIQSGTLSDDESIKPFHLLRDELSVYNGIVLRGDRIVVPESLRKRILKLSHESHVSVVRTKQFLRSQYFRIGMDNDVKDLIKNCDACAATRFLDINTPLQQVSFPKGTWVKGAVDVVGPVEDKYLITIIDYYSSFPEVVISGDINSRNTVRILSDMFARHGYPDEIVSDNGPQFVSNELKHFLSCNNIKHVRSYPYYPRSNGKIERFHRYLKKNFQAVMSEGKSWEEELPKILMSYRSIAYPTTGKTPASTLFNREICTRLSFV